MTEKYPPPFTATPLTGDPAIESMPSAAPPAGAEVPRDQAAEVGRGAVDAGQHVVEVTKDQVTSVSAEAGKHAKDLLEQARTELTEQAGQQLRRLVSGLHDLGDELQLMAHHTDRQGAATDIARQASTKSHEVASWLDQREPGRLVDEVKVFARQRPGTFLLLAAGVGLLAGRLTRGLKEASADDGRPFASSQDGPAGFPVAGDAL
jgi:hypothetical protein